MSEAVRDRRILGVAEVDLPREKLERLVPEALSDEGLLALLLKTGYEGRNVLEICVHLAKPCGSRARVPRLLVVVHHCPHHVCH